MSTAGSAPRHSVTVEIAGEKHVLRTDAAPEYTQAVAAHVDATIQLLGPARPVDTHRTAILASLFITDELFRTREELRRLREEIESRAGELADQLEQAVLEAAPAPSAESPDTAAS